MENNKIYNVDCLEGLKQLLDNSIDMFITSPPYWGLRDYNGENKVWDGVETCEHEWVENVKKPDGGRGSIAANVGANKNDFANMRDHNIVSYFCSKCGAWKGQLGLEPTFDLYIKHMISIFDEVKRVLKPTGTCWVNLGDTYAGSGKGAWDKKGNRKERYSVTKKYPIKDTVAQKSLCGIPDRFKIAMIDNGWICRNDIIWHKPNAMPSSVKDRFTVDYERIFFFTKTGKYYFEQQKEKAKYAGDNRGARGDSRRDVGYNAMNGKTGEYKNKRCVWSINTQPFKEAHFAVYPETLIETPIKAGCPEGGVVLDIFAGSGTTGVVAKKLKRNYILFEINKEYCNIAQKRLNG
jgi:site-specific DNA-methyltransferase (adenine-specific)